MIIKHNEVFLKERCLFMIGFCDMCRIWKQIIHRINTKLPIEKRIKVIDCDKYYDFGIIEHPLIRLYSPYIKGTYPVLFFEGARLDGANTREEVEAILMTLLSDEFIIEEELPYMYNKECRYVKSRYLGEKILCQ